MGKKKRQWGGKRKKNRPVPLPTFPASVGPSKMEAQGSQSITALIDREEVGENNIASVRRIGNRRNEMMQRPCVGWAGKNDEPREGKLIALRFVDIGDDSLERLGRT